MPLFGPPNIEKLKQKRDTDRLGRALRHKEWRIRRDAAQALGEIGDPRALEPLAGTLADQDWVVRKAAALALWELGDARGVEVLTKDLSDKDSDVRITMAHELLSHPDKDIRLIAALALRKLYDEPPFEDSVSYYSDPLDIVLTVWRHEQDHNVRTELEGILSRLAQALYHDTYDRDSKRKRIKAARALESLDDAILKSLFAEKADAVRLKRDVSLLEAERTEERFITVLQQLRMVDAPYLELKSSQTGDSYPVDMTDCPERSLEDMARALKKWVGKSSLGVSVDLSWGREGELTGTLYLWGPSAANVWRLGADAFKGCRYERYKDEDSFRGWL